MHREGNIPTSFILFFSFLVLNKSRNLDQKGAGVSSTVNNVPKLAELHGNYLQELAQFSSGQEESWAGEGSQVKVMNVTRLCSRVDTFGCLVLNVITKVIYRITIFVCFLNKNVSEIILTHKIQLFYIWKIQTLKQ